MKPIKSRSKQINIAIFIFTSMLFSFCCFLSAKDFTDYSSWNVFKKVIEWVLAITRLTGVISVGAGIRICMLNREEQTGIYYVLIGLVMMCLKTVVDTSSLSFI